MLKPTERFSSRVDDYVKYRPSYPSEVVDLAKSALGMTKDWVISDIGSGPGNLTRLFLNHGNAVFGVEPNKEMREAGERQMSSFANFTSVNGTAEDTRLETGSVQLITAAQAFHWFDLEPTNREFKRILVQGGWVALVGNERRIGFNRFSDEYERILLAYVPEYPSIKHADDDRRRLVEFFDKGYSHAEFDNAQEMTWDAFIGRVMSSSYIPQEGQPLHDEILCALQVLFDEENDQGTVRFVYDTHVFYGQL